MREEIIVGGNLLDSVGMKRHAKANNDIEREAAPVHAHPSPPVGSRAAGRTIHPRYSARQGEFAA
jgi:hypothetical protein